jgi:glutathione synthase/RimK-type ligase-like ATP-grasp enzyme
MTRKFIFPYKSGSRSALALSQLMGARLIRLKNSKFKGSKDKLIINWGSTAPSDEVNKCARVLNPFELITRASNKRNFLEMMTQAGNVSIPDWTTDKAVARGWLSEDKPPLIFARTILAGHSGEGIVKVANTDELDKIKPGTLLVKYVLKRHEFRIHVGRGGALIGVQQKRKRNDVSNEDVDFKIRNVANGFIFARQDIELPPGCLDQAHAALAATGLDFGAVDVIYNEMQKQAYVLEINTAPGLEGTTVEEYANYLGRL